MLLASSRGFGAAAPRRHHCRRRGGTPGLDGDRPSGRLPGGRRPCRSQSPRHRPWDERPDDSLRRCPAPGAGRRRALARLRQRPRAAVVASGVQQFARRGAKAPRGSRSSIGTRLQPRPACSGPTACTRIPKGQLIYAESRGRRLEHVGGPRSRAQPGATAPGQRLTSPGMTSVLALLVATGGAPTDWALGTAAAVVFVAVIALPAAALNHRDRKRRQHERPAGQ